MAGAGGHDLCCGPGQPGAADQQLSLNFHKSHHPLALTQNTGQPLSGNEDTDALNVTNVAPGRYYLTVLPYIGHAMGGAPVTVLPNSQDPGQTLDNVTVVVHEHPLPTAQIAVYLFEDYFPLNGTPDLPQEDAATTGVDFSTFRVIVEEPAGKYGANGGPLLQDAFGNPLGTTYQTRTGPCGAGDGTLTPNPDGTLLIKNLAPGKYGILITPPTGSGWTRPPPSRAPRSSTPGSRPTSPPSWSSSARPARTSSSVSPRNATTCPAVARPSPAPSPTCTCRDRRHSALQRPSLPAVLGRG